MVSKKIFFPFVKKEAAQGEARMLDGVYMEKGETEKYQAVVMIDNKFESWPQSGLSYAGLVYEAPVEGGITRFMAVFSSNREIEKIGPVRSIRPYYIDWAGEFSALMAHVGGSPEALETIASDFALSKLNLDGNGEYFWRASDRYAPHNAYTSSEKLDLARDAKLDADAKPDFSPWKFKNEAELKDRGEAVNVAIDFSKTDIYDVVWKYDKEKNIYIRQEGKAAKQTLEGSLVIAKNIAVLETEITVIDALSRRHIITIGEGNALIFQDGKKIEAMWEKKSREERLRFFDKSGKEIEFNRGTTWVEVVDGLDKVVEK